MPVKSTKPLQKHTINMYRGQMNELALLHPDAKSAAEVLRAITAAHIKKRKEELPPTTTPKISHDMSVLPKEESAE